MQLVKAAVQGVAFIEVEVRLFPHGCLHMHLFDAVVEVYQQTLAELLPQFLEVPHCEVDVVILWPAERALQGVDVAVVELFRQESATRPFFLLFLQERTVLHGEPFEEFAHEHGETLPRPRVRCIMAAVNEGVLLHGVPVEVTE